MFLNHFVFFRHILLRAMSIIYRFFSLSRTELKMLKCYPYPITISKQFENHSAAIPSRNLCTLIFFNNQNTVYSSRKKNPHLQSTIYKSCTLTHTGPHSSCSLYNTYIFLADTLIRKPAKNRNFVY